MRLLALYARCALIPDADFERHAALPDVMLAERYNVPLEQIAEKRLDFVLD